MSIQAVQVTRHRCEHCRRSWANKASATEHATRCWHDPAHRTCKTCAHHERGYQDDCGGRPGCRCADVPESCALGLHDFPPLTSSFGPIRFMCPGWKAAS